MTSGDDPLAAGLDGTLAAIAAELPALRREVRDLRAGERRLAVTAAVAVAVLALAIAGLAALVAHQNAGRIAAERSTEAAAAEFARDLCQSSNVYRTRELKVWEALIPAAFPRTAAGRAEVSRLLAQVRTLDTQRDCSRLSGGG